MPALAEWRLQLWRSDKKKCPIPRGCGLVLLTLPNRNAVVVTTIKRHFSALLVWPQLQKFLVLASLPRSDSGSVYWRGQTVAKALVLLPALRSIAA